MNRYIKYKQVCKLAILGNDDINNTTSSQYIIYPSKINGITINNAGTNYNDTSTQINIIGGGGNSAVATATTTSGAISAITLNNSGTDYIGPPSVIIASGITNITNLVGGSGYTTANTQVTVSGGGGAGATITAVFVYNKGYSRTLENKTIFDNCKRYRFDLNNLVLISLMLN